MTVFRVRLRRLLAVGVCSLTLPLTACDDGGSPSSPSGAAATVTITATGVSPVEVRIAAGGRVQFVNNDSRPHAVSSDPLQVHTDCPAINDVGTLSPGQSRSTGVLSAVRTCGFHDHTNEFDDRWKGRIIIQ
jgi:plastocyanin